MRSGSEYKNGAIPGAKHIYVPHLEEHLDELDKNQKIAVHYVTGYWVSVAESLLQKNEFERVINIPSSWTVWKAADLPVEQTT